MSLKKRLLFIIPVVIVIIAGLLWINTGKSYADSYKEIPPAYEEDSVVKVGDHYFRCVNDGDDVIVQMSDKKNSGYEDVYNGSVSDYWTNGRVIYTTVQNDKGNWSLVKYSISKDKATTLIDKLPNKLIYDEYDMYSVSKVYGKYVYLNRSSFYGWGYKLYRYDMKTSKLKKIMNDCAIDWSKGKYVLGINEFQTDVSAHKKTLYKIQSNGTLKKTKLLGKYVMSYGVAGNYIYYEKCTDSSGKKATIYRIKPDGTGRKKLGYLETKEEFGQVCCYNYTSKYCYVNGLDYSRTDCIYKYIYKTKKLKKVN